MLLESFEPLVSSEATGEFRVPRTEPDIILLDFYFMSSVARVITEVQGTAV